MQYSSRVHMRTSRRSRPSLAAFADSGYEPSWPIKASMSDPPQKLNHHNDIITHSSMGPADPFNLGVTLQLLPEDSVLNDPTMSTRSRKAQKMQSFPIPTGDSEQVTNISNRSGLGSGKFSSAFSKNGFANNSKSTTISRSATISSAWSGVSNRLCIESTRDVGNQREKNTFTEQFDKLAKKHGIQPFPYLYEAEPTPISRTDMPQDLSAAGSTPILAGNKFWNKLLRRVPSTIDVSKRHGNLKMSLTSKRTVSISDLATLGKGKKYSLNGMHLEDMIRLGGVAIFNLPLGLAAGDLLIPTCMHAAATFILTHGQKTPRIFRDGGNLNTTFALYDHYQRQLAENNNEAVLATTSLARLPSHIHFTIHEVANLFKKLIHGLPGGLLGSPAVFQALYDIHSFVYPDPSLGGLSKKVKARMIALALSSVNLHFRIALVCAVIGLLRAINLASEQKAEIKVNDPLDTSTKMKDDSLGDVFGPFLLGDKLQDITIEELQDPGRVLVQPRVGPVSNTVPNPTKKAEVELAHPKTEYEKTRRAAMVCQMLIDNWEDICYQLRKIDTLNLTAQAYDLPAKVQPDFEYQLEEKTKAAIQDHHEHKLAPYEAVNACKGAIKSKINLPHPFLLGHCIQKPHVPYIAGHQLHEQIDDLMNFPYHTNTPEQSEDLFKIPLFTERSEMTPIFEMTPTRSIKQQTPIKNMTPIHQMISPQAQEPEDSPNWRIIDPQDMEVPQTPIRILGNIYNHADEGMDISSGHGGSTRISSASTDPGSPIDITPQPARRVRQSLATSSFVLDDVEDDTLILSEQPDIVTFNAPRNASATTFGPRAISLSPELSFTPQPTTNSLTDIQTPIAPKPLSYRKKSTSRFSIFEDDPDVFPKYTDAIHLKSSPVFTVIRPTSKVSLKKNVSFQSSKYSESPTHPQSIPLQPATPNRRPRISLEDNFEDKDFFEGGSPSPGKTMKGNTALYAEIRRLQRLVDVKTEEANSTRKELELVKNMANAGTLSHIVRETQEEMKIWKNRAEWAEKQLKTVARVEVRNINTNQKASSHRYSMG